ncbi:MAG: hypothetical protein PW789_11030 [Edaphobacter sp.]|uniref:hypothetical protein n=1 Tax=Edaphobacter sp. TaxID=1934404 RepID=UPI00239CD6C3|nr:hypothetical protein [Edaphobacter sp.]MDE1177120.1 hypothetical protein [Edaphobacter sp.]
MKSTKIKALATFALVFITATLIVGVVIHRRHLRSAAEAGLRKEISENNDGLQQMRESLPKEIDNLTAIVTLMTEREAGRPTDERTPAKLGLAVMAFTNANWQAASATGAVELMNYQSVERFAGAYFEQARLAQLQTATLESMMGLTSYVGHGERIASMTPEQARLADVQAQLLLAHLRMMLRMSEGVQGAYKEALAPAAKAE